MSGVRDFFRTPPAFLYENRWEDLAVEVFRNRQRPSSMSGILKSEAVYRFARARRQAGPETLANAPDVPPARFFQCV